MLRLQSVSEKSDNGDSTTGLITAKQFHSLTILQKTKSSSYVMVGYRPRNLCILRKAEGLKPPEAKNKEFIPFAIPNAQATT